MHRAVLRAGDEHLAVGAVGRREAGRRPRVSAHLELRRFDAVHDHAAVDRGREVASGAVPTERGHRRIERRQRVRRLQRRRPKKDLLARRRCEPATVRRPCRRRQAAGLRALLGEQAAVGAVPQCERAVLPAGDERRAARLPGDRLRAEQVLADLVRDERLRSRPRHPLDEEHLALAARHREPDAIGRPGDVGDEVVQHHRAERLEDRGRPLHRCTATRIKRSRSGSPLPVPAGRGRDR